MELPVKDIKKSHLHRAQHLYFLKESVERNGRVVLNDPTVLDFTDPFHPVSFVGKTRSFIFESSPDYYVIGRPDNTIFRIIHRKNLNVLFKTSPGDSDVCNNSKPNFIDHPSAPSHHLFNSLSGCKIRMVCTPYQTEQVIIRGEQIFFRSAYLTYIYTPYSSSLIDIPSTACSSDYFLYFLNKNSISIFGSKLLRKLDLSHSCDGICVVNGLIFLYYASTVFKLSEDGRIQYYTAKSNILKASAGPYRERTAIKPNDITKHVIYLLLGSGNLLILNTWTMTGQIITFGYTFKELIVTNSLILVYDGLNAYTCLSRSDTSVVHSAVVDPQIHGISGFENEISFLTRYSVITLSDYKPWCEQLNYEPLHIYTDILLASKSTTLDDQIQRIIDGDFNSTNKSNNSGSEPDILVITRLMEEHETESSSEEESSESTCFYQSEECEEIEREFKEVEEMLGECRKKRKVKNSTEQAADLEIIEQTDGTKEYERVLNTTGITNTEPIEMFINVYANKERIEIQYRKYALRYRDTTFFTTNYSNWLEATYDERREPIILLEYSTYEFIAGLWIKSARKKETISVKEQEITKKRKGGF